MNTVFPILVRGLGVFVVACGLQYLIPWFFLAPAGTVAGFFMLKTSNDRPMSLGMMIGSIAFGIFAYAMSKIYPMGG